MGGGRERMKNVSVVYGKGRREEGKEGTLLQAPCAPSACCCCLLQLSLPLSPCPPISLAISSFSSVPLLRYCPYLSLWLTAQP